MDSLAFFSLLAFTFAVLVATGVVQASFAIVMMVLLCHTLVVTCVLLVRQYVWRVYRGQ